MGAQHIMNINNILTSFVKKCIKLICEFIFIKNLVWQTNQLYSIIKIFNLYFIFRSGNALTNMPGYLFYLSII